MDAYLRWAKAQAEAHWADPTKQHMTLLMGNEAGDLDSAASAIALSYVMNHEPRYFMAVSYTHLTLPTILLV